MATSPSHSAIGNGKGFAVENVRDGHSSVPVEWERLARATAHPLRISILEILGIDGGRTMSPSDLCRELRIPLSNTNYHVTELAKAGLIELVRQRQVRGATEHFYCLPAVLPSSNGSSGGGNSSNGKGAAELEPALHSS